VRSDVSEERLSHNYLVSFLTFQQSPLLYLQRCPNMHVPGTSKIILSKTTNKVKIIDCVGNLLPSNSSITSNVGSSSKLRLSKLVLPQCPTFDPNWKIWTTPKPTGDGMLDALDRHIPTPLLTPHRHSRVRGRCSTRKPLNSGKVLGIHL
jgi:hypothetical protein